MGQNLLAKIVDDIIERNELQLGMFNFGGADEVRYYGIVPDYFADVWLAIHDKVNHVHPTTMGVLLHQANDPVRDTVDMPEDTSISTGRTWMQTILALILERRVFWCLYDRLVEEQEATHRLVTQRAASEAWLSSLGHR
jgi:hypothetical protein